MSVFFIIFFFWINVACLVCFCFVSLFVFLPLSLSLSGSCGHYLRLSLFSAFPHLSEICSLQANQLLFLNPGLTSSPHQTTKSYTVCLVRHTSQKISHCLLASHPNLCLCLWIHLQPVFNLNLASLPASLGYSASTLQGSLTNPSSTLQPARLASPLQQHCSGFSSQLKPFPALCLLISLN